MAAATGGKEVRVDANTRQDAVTMPAAPAEVQPPTLMEKPLPAEIAYRMLVDPKFKPGSRPTAFDGRDGRWVFKEKAGTRAPACRLNNKHFSGSVALADRADRWHNSGGVRGARDMPIAKPLVRRRYGSVSREGHIMWRFHEYSLITPSHPDERADAAAVDDSEDRSTVVFHIMPKRAGRGRPSKAEAALPEKLWLQYLGPN